MVGKYKFNWHCGIVVSVLLGGLVGVLEIMAYSTLVGTVRLWRSLRFECTFQNSHISKTESAATLMIWLHTLAYP